MKPYLMYRQSDLELEAELPVSSEDLTEDLELVTIWEAMAAGDKYLFEVCRRVMLMPLTDEASITYRQRVLVDFLEHPEIARQIYEISLQAAAAEREIRFSFIKYPSAILRRSIALLDDLVKLLRKLREMADNEKEKVSSEGLSQLFAMLQDQLSDEYFEEIEQHLRQLRFRDGVLISAKLGKGLKGVRYVLRASHKRKVSWKERIGAGPRTSYSFEIHPRDDAGAKALSQLNDKGLNPVANALAQSTDQVVGLFSRLRQELAFYVGCLNLRDRLAESDLAFSIPLPGAIGSHILSFEELRDVALVLQAGDSVVSNSIDADRRELVMITGANSGGKSTFLRSIGQAQLMLQCGMFVSAKSLSSSIRAGVYTHFIREEDATMVSGRFDEELMRMSTIADGLSSFAMVLFNESFAATNEREGAEIAGQILRALRETEIFVVMVTHVYSLASQCDKELGDRALFLRAERRSDGTRTFKLVVEKPLSTSFGEDLYRRVGGFAPETGDYEKAIEEIAETS